MESPYTTPIFVIGLISGVVAGLIPGRSYIRWLNRFYIVALGACISWFLEVPAVEWAYSHPFNPNDGAPLVFASVFGWLAALIWPILPAMFAVVAIRFVHHRIWGVKGSEP